MAAPGKFLGTFLVGTGLGAGPYGAAVAAGGIPTQTERTAEREENKFGEVCLLDEDLCQFMMNPTDHTNTDQEGEDKSEQKPWEKLDPSVLEARWDDVCVWGFHDETLNSLAECKPEKKPTTEGGVVADNGETGAPSSDSKR